VEASAQPSDVRPVVVLSEDHGVAVVALAGDWDFTQAARLRERIETLREASIVLDLRRATFIDSTIIAVVVRAQRRRSAEGGSVALRLPDDGLMKRMFAMMSLDRALEDQADASSHFASVERPANVLEKNARRAACGSADLRTSS